jgi:hypothetical protein
MGTRTWSRKGVLTAAGRRRAGMVAQETVPLTMETLTFPPDLESNRNPLEAEYTPAGIYESQAAEKRMIQRYKEIQKKPTDRTSDAEKDEMGDLYRRLRVHLLGLNTILQASRPAELIPENAPEDYRVRVSQQNAQRISLTDTQRNAVYDRWQEIGRTVGGFQS